MKNLTDEIKLTLELMQGDIDDGAHGELQSHLYSLLEMKRELLGERVYTYTPAQIQIWPDAADDRIDVIGQNGNDGEHYREALINKPRAEAELLRMQLAACGVVAMANTPESASKARAMHPEYMSASCQDVMRAVDREMALRDQVSRQAEPLTVGELMAGGWRCDDVSEECRLAFYEKGLGARSIGWSTDTGYKYCYLSGSVIVRSSMQPSDSSLKQIHRVGNQFYWGDA